jgi:hypothetical protein
LQKLKIFVIEKFSLIDAKKKEDEISSDENHIHGCHITIFEKDFGCILLEFITSQSLIIAARELQELYEFA